MTSVTSSEGHVGGRSSAQSMELRGCRVADVSAGRLHPADVRVIVEAGEVVALPGLPGEPDLSGRVAHDLGGRTVVPGLINSHAHVALPVPAATMGVSGLILAKRHGRAQVHKSLADCLDRGVTTVRDAWTEDLRTLARIEGAIASGERERPRLLRSVMVAPPGGTFTARRGTAARLSHKLVGLPFVPFDDVASGVVVFPVHGTTSAVRRAVDRAIDERGAETIKVYDQQEKALTYEPGATVMSQTQLDAAADQARSRGVPCTMHHVSCESFRRGLRAGVTSLAHMPLDGPLDDRDLEAFADSAVLLEPTATLAYFYAFHLDADPRHPRLMRLEQLRTAEHRAGLEELWLPELRPVVREGLERAARGDTRLAGLVDVSPPYRFFSRLVSHGMDNLCRAVAAAGTERLACGNDAGADPGTPAALGLELEMLRFCLDGHEGLRFGGAEALRTATLGSARALGLDDRLGTVERGKLAELAILDGDPFEDPAIIGRPVAGLVRGGRLEWRSCDPPPAELT